MKFFTLYQLNKSIQKLITGIGRDFWIIAEIAQVQLGNHCYMELVQKEEENTSAIIAKARATIWHGQLLALHQKLGENLEAILKPGSKVMMKVVVSFHEIHGLSLTVTDLNEQFTLGELEKKRQETIRRLTEEGLLERQQLLEVPLVVQRIAVISSPTAAGYTDFITQLQQNPYGYQYHLTFFAASVQGERAAKEILIQLAKIDPQDFDAIVLIRGGGSKLDLEVFNSYDIAAQIAMSRLPVITGIGHQRDTSVCDLVARIPLKTPTAVAEFLIQRMLHVESTMLEQFQFILANAERLIQLHTDALQQNSQRIFQATQQSLQQQHIRLANQELMLHTQVKNLIQREALQLTYLAKEIQHLSPENILKKGYTITYLNGELLKDQQVKKGDLLKTVSANHEIESEALRTKKIKKQSIE
ncbi:MAG: exodeoxyribonuclease VII large subunit [Flammeovirgaceae bacterium]